MSRLFRWALAVLLVSVWCLGCWKGQIPETRPMIVRSPTDTAAFAERVAQADGYITGTIEKLEPDWTYDDPCGLIMNMMNRCDGTATYSFEVVGSGVKKWLWSFVPYYGYLPLVAGMDATFVYRHVYAFQYKNCKDRAAMTQTSCPADRLPAVLDTMDIVPHADSARVARLFESRP